jgi:hypothetical protein
MVNVLMKVFGAGGGGKEYGKSNYIVRNFMFRTAD